MTFGHKLEYYAEIKRAKNEVNIAKYKESITNHVSEIAEENLQEPQMSIVGPALEASKYYIEEEELREMFAKVVAASMDSSKNDIVHHSYVEVIKQLSPRDAHILSSFKFHPNQPAVKYLAINHGESNYKVVKPLIYTFYKEPKEIDELDSSSMSNLIRLGLLSYIEDKIIAEGIYSVYDEDSYFDKLREQTDTEDYKLATKHGSVVLTTFGSIFISVCL